MASADSTKFEGLAVLGTDQKSADATKAEGLGVLATPQNAASSTKFEGLGVLGTPQQSASSTKYEGLNVLGPLRTSGTSTKYEGLIVLGTPQDAATTTKTVAYVIFFPIEVPELLVYPTLPGLAYSVHWTIKAYNMPTSTTQSGADIDLGITSVPLHEFELTYTVLRDQFGQTELRTMMGFFGAIRGILGRFLFKNPDDFQVSQQVIATGDGSTASYTLQRTYGTGDYSWIEPVGQVDLTCPFRVYLNGVLQDPSTYRVDQTFGANNQLIFTTPPGNGVIVTADMNYYYYCKVSEDSLDFEKFLFKTWQLKKIILHSCRAGA